MNAQLVYWEPPQGEDHSIVPHSQGCSYTEMNQICWHRSHRFHILLFHTHWCLLHTLKEEKGEFGVWRTPRKQPSLYRMIYLVKVVPLQLTTCWCLADYLIIMLFNGIYLLCFSTAIPWLFKTIKWKHQEGNKVSDSKRFLDPNEAHWI